ncbi:hypothetical protein E1293_36015 [Actinomadura darangshiensis]|uniref:DUF3558 domain-containing protein n=1 Tax=Actinomadura darangshiensis TaxID=705336 RepID=A0A4R5AD87_9ACTN|nr:hypothetical protein [Actinomadura darangshiensis]TDD69220.1 hypothetical protein E1293_36015 [Actinomadura darangshiensis]
MAPHRSEAVEVNARSLPRELARAYGRRLRTDVRTRLVTGLAAIIVAVIAVAVAAMWPSGPEESETSFKTGKLAALRTAPDRVPKQPAIPKDCGVPQETLKALVRGSSTTDACSWYALTGGNSKERSLKIGRGTGYFKRFPTSLRGPLATLSPHPPRRLSGLGDEAMAYYSVSGMEGTGLVVFQFRGETFTAAYEGWDGPPADPAKVEPLPEKDALAGAMRAAADLATALGAPSRPVEQDTPAQAGGPAALKRVPKPCDTVREDTIDGLAAGAVPQRGTEASLSDAFGATTDSCVWGASRYVPERDRTPHEETRRLAVTITSIPDREPGFGVRAARTDYLALHQGARGDGATVPAPEMFSAVAGLGEEAWISYGKLAVLPGKAATVTFRVRNVLVRVTYMGSMNIRTDKLIPRDQALRGVYTAALDVAEELQP